MLKPEYANIINSFVSENAALEKKTTKYWKLMRCWNGIDYDKKMTVSKALDQINHIQDELNPQRPLNIGLIALKEDIVEFGSKAKSMKGRVPQERARITIL